MKKIKKILLLTMLTCICFSFSSCNWFIDRPEAKRIGCSHIQYDRGIYFVEIDSVKYTPMSIYTNQSSMRVGRLSMKPVDGMLVTAFTLDGNNKVEFIAGDLDEKYLEDYFENNHSHFFNFLITTMFVMIILAAVVYYQEKKENLKKQNRSLS